MKEVLFYMLPLLEFDEGKPLHLSHVLTSFLSVDDAITSFYSNHLDDYRETYTAGHYGEPSCEWVFSHHEVYTQEDPQMPTIVILRYRPRSTTEIDTQTQSGMTIEEGQAILRNCLDGLEKVFDSKDDLTSSHKFGESLHSAIALVDYCVADLSEDEED